MTIRYTTTRGDLLVANFRTLVRNRFLQILWSLVIIWACYSALREPKMIEQDIGHKIGFTLFFATFYFATLLGITFALTSTMLLLRKNKGVLGEHRLSISEEGLTESTEHNESLHRWSAYHKTVSTKTYLMLYVSEGQFHFISKNRPLVEGDINAFEALLKTKTKTP